ncbi:MAG: FAD-dependent oxidoreductase [Candidatus Micrarchaeaceae archaeon]
MDRVYDLIIVGGGITGTALLFAASRYTDIRSILLLEKYGKLATLNSNARSNSQTLHVGDVETNYSKEKALKVKEEALYLLNYTKKFIQQYEKDKVIQQCQKMVLGVGDEEGHMLEKTFDSIRSSYPGLKLIGRSELATIEPRTVKGRPKDEKLTALLSDMGYMLNFGNVAESFVKNATMSKKKIDVKFDSPVTKVERGDDYYRVYVKGDIFKAKFVAFEAGTYSLYFAKKLGYDKGLSILAIGGGYYFSKRLLRGKVYRVQHGGIPFAAIHADPDITNPDVIRYGPTVSLEFELEKGHPETIPDYIKTFNTDAKNISAINHILMNEDIKRIIENNMSYSLPVVGKHRFVENEAKKIIPNIKYDDVWIDRSTGGIRPQIVDENTGSLMLGEAKLQKEGFIFNITPSPGASSCLGSALEDIKYICKYIDANFDIESFKNELG